MAAPTTTLATHPAPGLERRTSTNSLDDAFSSEDTTEVTKLFAERLSAWRAVVKHLEDYVESTEKLHNGQGKDYEKIVKSVSKPIKHAEHFDQSLGGVSGFLDNVRTNTQGISNSHNETAKTLKTSVVPIFSRLDTEIKAKSKELIKGAGKGGKAVDKARTSTQKHIESLGQSSAIFDSRGGKMAANEDPYVLQRGVVHRLSKQLIEENANRQDLLAVQNNFASFETHIITSIQNGLGQFNTVVSKQADITKNLYGDSVANVQRIPSEFEWIKFLERNQNVLIDPSAGPRDIANVAFPNQNHRSTLPLISGSLQKKSKLLRKYETFYYVVTPSKFLHEYKTDDDVAKDPLPETSLFLPDCIVGQALAEKFTIKGKDSSKGPMGLSLHTSHEFNFKAHTAADALKWWTIIRDAAGQVTNEIPSESTPSSPITQSASESEKFGTIPPQQPVVGAGTAAYPPASAEKAALAAGHQQPIYAGQSTGTVGVAAPLSQAPIAQAPLTQAPITQAPLTQAPITQTAPITQAPPSHVLPSSAEPTTKF